jgi:hypothetical protein
MQTILACQPSSATKRTRALDRWEIRQRQSRRRQYVNRSKLAHSFHEVERCSGHDDFAAPPIGNAVHRSARAARHDCPAFFLHRNCSCGGEVEPTRRRTYIHGLHSATELLLFAPTKRSIFLSLTQRCNRHVAPTADKATKSRQHCNPSRATPQPRVRAQNIMRRRGCPG